MPGFGDVLTDDDRWDIINFLGAFSIGYQARIIEPKINPGQYWLAPPDFQVTDETGNTNHFERLSAQVRDPRGAFFLYARERGARDGAARTAIGRPRHGWPSSVPRSSWLLLARFASRCARLATGKILVADHDTADVAATYGLFTRTFLNRKMDVVRVPETHAEFLIDRSGYIRARWLPEEDNVGAISASRNPAPNVVAGAASPAPAGRSLAPLSAT